MASETGVDVKFAIKYLTAGCPMWPPYWCWVCEGEWGPTSFPLNSHAFPAPTIDKLNSNRWKPLLFDTFSEAEAFISTWAGHPADSETSGKYEIIKVVHNMVLIQKGWKEAE